MLSQDGNSTAEPVPTQCPRPVAITAAVMAASVLAGYVHVMFFWAPPGGSLNGAVRGIVTLSYAAVLAALWFYCRGKNWARWVMLLLAGSTLYNLRHLAREDLFIQVKLVVQAGVGAYLLYWLNTRAAKSYFGAD
jgi:hypothetical protein